MLLLVFWGCPLNAEEDASRDAPEAEPSEEEATFDEDDCSALFGSEAIENKNEFLREKRLRRVMRSGEIITVVHSSKKWTTTTHGRCEGLTLESIEKDENGENHAFFDVSDEVAERYGCHSGVYEVTQDASIYSTAAVLWIGSDFVLLGYEGELSYLTLDPDARFIVRLAWQSPWTIRRIRNPSKSKPRRNKRRHKRKRGRRGRRR